MEARHAERLGADLRVPGVEAPEEQVGRAVWQASGLDGVEIVDEEHENIAIAGLYQVSLISTCAPSRAFRWR
jgi:hypothetical protein